MTILDTNQIRNTLNMAFDDSELVAFCLDYFPVVYDRFSEGIRKDDKITLLLDYCRRHPTRFETLLNHLPAEHLLTGEDAKLSRPMSSSKEAEGTINIGHNAQIGELYTGGKRQINTAGGAYFEGNVNTGGGNFAGGNQTNVERITDSTGLIIGDNGQVINQGATHDELAKQFAQIYERITQESEAFQEILNSSVKSIQEESTKGQQADVKKIEGQLAILARMAPDILEVTANTLLNPIHGLATAIQKVADALALRGKLNNNRLAEQAELARSI